ncbi:MAG: 4-hydroxy-tetrahydrodipicolinate synthase [Gemmatimonadetes bacterium]|nr:4-hydroxy-tetrahydrodipicolinate synthase [Gemmatimonadota bacterium]NIQ51960.1 4-hydroxy-tetrahydrodipicolinate synthase [Gemmatimonadota bacterium]NIU72063.1 4-hydroxy-tetrahydrodipicolinate synthase [Gammaproteobacteria bacterium]NIX42623.1 4-hydroxy-tetrahydrodipicolinate synthase [Gemmatimonadota bacterium]
MELRRFRGTAVALVTPFKSSGVVDETALAGHVEWCIEGGVDVLVPCGTTGESATMSAEEQRRVIALAVETAAGRAAVMAGAGGNDTADVVRRVRAAREAGADGILSVSPYYNKPTPEGLVAHYRAVAEEAERPVFVYNVPGRTASNISPDTLFRLAEIENVAGVKEASGDIEQIMTILAGRPDGFLVLSGDDALTLAVLALGGDGVVSVAANEAPDLMSEMVRAGLTGDLARARELHYRLLPLMQANFVETNPIPVKSALEMIGRMPAHFRLPLVPLGESSAAVLKDALERAGLSRT